MVLFAFAAGCTSNPAGNTGTVEKTTAVVTTQEPVEITVFAAASLKGALTDIIDQFQAENKNIKVVTNFAGSQALKTQIQEGADVDIFISANDKQFDPINEAGMIKEKKVLLTNKLAIAVPAANTAGISNLGDLSKSGTILVIGNKDVPFGSYTRDIIQKYQDDGHAGYVDAFMGNVVSEVDAVDKIKPVLVLGEADGSIVYKSDISKADKKDITLIEIPDKYN
ncbi:MAG: molybdate ABC transporter substrate-binding protein, partial [Methanomicrobium sp.]|nr:molybdate ABC transporter substrate-binding protein [Methanomicrobium sp.]